MDDEISVEQRNEVAAYKRQIVEVEHSLRNAYVPLPICPGWHPWSRCIGMRADATLF